MNRPSPLLCAALLAMAVSFGLPCFAVDSDTPAPAEHYVKAHYSKYEFRIPMRDGVRLFTAVYVPKDRTQPWPFLITRTPYSIAPYGEDQYKDALGPADEFEKAGYIFVYQDARWRFLSEGRFVEMTPHIDNKKTTSDVDDAADLYDTLEFLLKHVPNNNGKAGIYGVSYPGFYTAASMIDSHPALKAASPQAPMVDLFMGDDAYHGGAFMLAQNFDFYTSFRPFDLPSEPKPSLDFDPGVRDSYKFFLQAGNLANLDKTYLKGSNSLWNDQLNHPTYDAYWQTRDLSRHLRNIHCAVLTVGGWFDAEDIAGPIRVYNEIAKLDPGTENLLVEGPWPHGGWQRGDGDHLGDINFIVKSSAYFRQNIEFPFFEHYLKGKGSPLEGAYVFETGTNVWRTFKKWPPAAARPKTLYFAGGGKLSFDPPTEAQGVDEYVSDPARPVPFVGYTTDTVPQRFMVDDQRFASYRPDVLVYETDPLEEDITIAGPVEPRLKVASTGTDSDFVVKLIDVYPENYPDPEIPPHPGKPASEAPPVQMGSYQQLLRGNPMRAKFRHSWEKPEPLTPNEVTDIDFTMPDLFHTFRRGHRIMVQVQSSWFPLVDHNPQTFTGIPNARPEEFKKATEKIFRNKTAASGVEVLLLPQP